MIVVADSGPIIYLSRLGKLELLRELFQDVVVPAQVFHEVSVVGAGPAGSSELQQANWIRTMEADPAGIVYQRLIERLDSGEAAAITPAVHLRASFVLCDDPEARIQAGIEGVEVMGTLGVLLVAKRKGLIDEVSSLLEQLAGTNFRAAPELIDAIKSLAGE